MVAELNIVTEWLPEQIGAWNYFCAGKRGRGRRSGRSILGRSLLPGMRHTGFDHPQADARRGAGDLRIKHLSRPIRDY